MQSTAMRCLKCSMRSDVLMVLILNALIVEILWLEPHAVQAERLSRTSKRDTIQRNDDWSDDNSDKIKNSTTHYNTFLGKMQERKIHIEDLKWAGEDPTTTKGGERDSSRLGNGNRNKNVLNSQRITPYSIIARDADFSHANLSNTVRLSDLNKLKKFNKVDFDALQNQAKRLNLANNAIEYLDESVAIAFSNIEQLDVAYNNIENFNLSVDKFHVISYRRLKVLNLTGNCLKSFQGAHMNSLEILDLSCNHLSTFRINMIQNMTSLKVLNLAGNYLSTIRRDYFESLNNAEVLILSKNNINNIESDAFEYLTNLQFLDLSYNKLSASSLHALQNIPGLSGLSVAYNDKLGNALQGFVTSWSIKKLDVSHTGLFEIPAVLAQSVHSLNLSRNHFTILRCGDLDSYPLIKNLDMSFCNINDIEDDAFGRLEILASLNVCNNNLSRIPSTLPIRLVYLNLKNNRVMDIRPSSFVQLSNLKMLDLSGNKIIYVPGLPLPNLITLNLRSSHVEAISQSVVKMSPRLKDIFLDDNPIKCSELLSIAEWATPCRTYKIDDRISNSQEEYVEIFTQPLEGLNPSHCLNQCPQQRVLLTNSAAKIELNGTVSENQTKVGASGGQHQQTLETLVEINFTAGESKEMSKPLARTQNLDHLDAQRVHRSEVTQVPVTGNNIPIPRAGLLLTSKTMMNASSRGLNISRSMRSKFIKENKYRKEGKNQKLSFVGEDYKVNLAAITSHSSSSPHESTEINTSTDSNFENDKNSLKNYKKLQSLDSVPVGTTESLSDYRVVPNSAGLLAFLSFTSGICFFVYLFYLYRCKKSHTRHYHINDCCENKKRMKIAHLQMNKFKIEKMYPDVPDTLW